MIIGGICGSYRAYTINVINDLYEEKIMILVTGGTGYIGSHTVVQLMEEGYETVVVDNFVNSKPEVLDNIEKITGKRPLFVEADLRDREALEKIFTAYDIDSVIHFAGLKAVGESVSKPLEYYDNNIGGTITLIEVMREHGCKKIIFSSSATVYSQDNEMPLTEGSKTGNCTNPYGWTKYMIERMLMDICHADPDFTAVLLRYFNPIGAHKSGLIGEDPQGIPNNLMPYICKVASGELERLSVYGSDYPTKDGSGVRDYIHVVDLADGHLKAIRYMEDHKGAIPFNLGTGKGYSVLEVVAAFEKANDLKINKIITGRRPGDVAVCYADPSLANRELGWKVKYDIEEMCEDSWRFTSQRIGK